MSLLTDGTIGHGSCLEALHDCFGRLHLVKRNRLTGKTDIHQAANGTEMPALVINKVLIFLKQLIVAGTAGVLKKMDRLRA